MVVPPPLAFNPILEVFLVSRAKQISRKIYIWHSSGINHHFPDVSISNHQILSHSHLTQWSRFQKSSQEFQQLSLNITISHSYQQVALNCKISKQLIHQETKTKTMLLTIIIKVAWELIILKSDLEFKCKSTTNILCLETPRKKNFSTHLQSQL